MTTKQLNAIRHLVFEQAVSSMTAQEKEWLRFGFISTLFEIREGDKVERGWFSYRGVTVSYLTEHGFTKGAEVVRLIRLNWQTKCADYINL